MQFSLTNFNSYRIISTCKNAFFPKSEIELKKVFSDKSSYPFIILGNGNNIILSKEHYEETFIIFNNNYNEIEIKNNIIIAEAGVSLLQLSNFALENRKTGLEIFYDIPGSLGGAVVMNAGADGNEIGQHIIKVRVLNLNSMQFEEYEHKDLFFHYRSSIFQSNNNLIVSKVWLNLNDGNYESILFKMNLNKNKRWQKQPREYPNAGSVFKRPANCFVGPMIDELGLKGYCIGDAQVSEKHSGFIINRGNASGKDILELIFLIKEKVLNTFGIELEIEQRII